MAGVDLTFEELQLVRIMLHGVGRDLRGQQRTTALSAYTKIMTTIDAIRCSHCRSRPTRRTSGLCDACDSYSRKYGVLPSLRVLNRRVNA